MKSDRITNRGRSALCLIVETKGSTPRKTGTRMTVFEDGSIEGTIGGGSFEKKVIEDALGQLRAGQPRLFEHHLLQEHEMCCGGSVKVYIEPEPIRQKLYIFGAGHVGKEVAGIGQQAGFEVKVYDDREEYIQQIQFPGVDAYCMDFMEALASIGFDERSYVVILTYRHDIDRAILRYCLGQKRAYLGFIGSLRKILVTRKMMLKAGVATEVELDEVKMPIGLNIGAETPFEIAVSIVAQLIEVKNRNQLTVANQILDIEQCLAKMPEADQEKIEHS